MKESRSWERTLRELDNNLPSQNVIMTATTQPSGRVEVCHGIFLRLTF